MGDAPQEQRNIERKKKKKKRKKKKSEEKRGRVATIIQCSQFPCAANFTTKKIGEKSWFEYK